MKKSLLILTIIFTIIIIRLFFIYSNNEYYLKLLDNKINNYIYSESAPRGRILDRNGKVLVDNIGVKTIYYNKLKSIDTKKEIEIARVLASILSVSDAKELELKKYYLVNNNNGNDLITKEEYDLYKQRKINNSDLIDMKMKRITKEMLESIESEKKAAHIYALMNTSYNYAKKIILKNVSESEYAKVIELNLPGINGELFWERKYLYGDTLKNIFGNIGSVSKEEKDEYIKNGYELTDIVGISYLEKQYESYLKGTKAKYLVKSDNSLELVSPETRGSDLILSIDINLQLEVESIIKKRILEGKKSINTTYYQDSYAIVGNPFTGEILALGGMRLNKDMSWSDISLNNINKSFTVGSAVKGATIAVGYKYGLIEEDKYITDSCIKLYMVPEKCSHKRLGKINDLKALAQSSNYYQFLIAIKLTGNTYKSNMKINATQKEFDIYRGMLGSFGLGVKTEIDLPNETTGIIGTKIADDLLLNLAIGQYDTYTPIEMLQYANSLASGKRIALGLMKEIRNDNQIVKKQEVNVLNEVDIDNEHLSRIKEGLKLVLSEGTGKFYVPQGYNFAGKTGTSQSFLDTDSDNVVDTATISSSFVGFFPADKPLYSLTVIAPNVSYKSGKSGMYYGASKITKDIANLLIKKYA